MTNIDPLLHIDYSEYRTGIAYVRALVEADPTINLSRYLRICHYHGLNNVRGYSKCRFHSAVRGWREENGYPVRPAGRRGVSKPANWLPEDGDSHNVNEKAPEPAENGVSGAALYPDKGSDPEATSKLDGAALAELVWEWMSQHDLEMVAFWDDGEVNVKRNEPKEREYRLVVDGEEA